MEPRPTEKQRYYTSGRLLDAEDRLNKIRREIAEEVLREVFGPDHPSLLTTAELLRLLAERMERG